LSQLPGNPGNVGDFNLVGHIGSLIPTDWVSIGNGGFTDPSVVPPVDGTPSVLARFDQEITA
jgi:hypothetical protein